MKLLSLVVALAGTLAFCGQVTPQEEGARPADVQPASRNTVGVDVRGRVMDVDLSEDAGGVLATVLVEGHREPDTQVDSASVRITGDTRITFTAPGSRADLDDLMMGTLIEVRFAGPVAESYPVQATAAEVRILEVPPASSVEADVHLFEGTIGVVDRPSRARSTVMLRAVRTARHDGFDRTVFEFEGADLPAYHIEYIEKPVRQCASGEAVPIRGGGWLHVRFSGAAAHTELGEATVGFRERQVDLPTVLEVESICDFEGEVSWVLGVRSLNQYRTVEFSGPTRLVVDVAHR
jgi:hypothetical protein